MMHYHDCMQIKSNEKLDTYFKYLEFERIFFDVELSLYFTISSHD